MVAMRATAMKGTNVLKRPSIGGPEKPNFALAASIRGVVWCPHRLYWHAYWHEGGKRRDKYFDIGRYRSCGMNFVEAQVAAMEAAIAFRSGKDASRDSATDSLRSPRSSKLPQPSAKSKFGRAGANAKSRGPQVKRTVSKAYAKAKATVHASIKKSGVPGVTWVSNRNAWQVHCYARGQRQCRVFSVSKYREPGMTQKRAEKAALLAAIALRRRKEASGEARVSNSFNLKGRRSSSSQSVTQHQRTTTFKHQGGKSSVSQGGSSKPTVSKPKATKPTVARRPASHDGYSKPTVARRPASEPSRRVEREARRRRFSAEGETSATAAREGPPAVSEIKAETQVKAENFKADPEFKAESQIKVEPPPVR